MAVAVNIEAPRIIVRRTVSSSAAIPKGTLLQFSGTPNTVTATGSQNELFAGIAVEEKVSTETDVLSIGVAIDGVWKIDTTAAAIAVGIMVEVGGANSVIASTNGDWEAGSLVGRAEETRDGDNRIRVRLIGV